MKTLLSWITLNGVLWFRVETMANTGEVLGIRYIQSTKDRLVDMVVALGFSQSQPILLQRLALTLPFYSTERTHFLYSPVASVNAIPKKLKKPCSDRVA